jgi:murein DD-endopeptidase MepM/ murein hydrolase activator NlpD
MLRAPITGFLLILLAVAASRAEPLNLVLPTDNDALLRGEGPAFYQYIDRDYQGEKSTPWEGGRYGFVRNPRATSGGIVYTRLHEGIDIKPLQRDASGEPTDVVRAIAPGVVVHASQTAGYSNYGRYVVVEHRFDGCKYYSLYGHLSSIAVHPGQHVQPRDQLGIMGHTGEGLNQARAHVHLELNLMLSGQFEAWHEASFKNDPNRHGIYNGLNLVGIDIARLYLALQKRPGLTIPEFLAEEETLYRVLLPASKHFDLPKFYPWLLGERTGGDAVSWEVSFNRVGVPLKIRPGTKAVTEAELSYLKPSDINAADLTMDRLAGRGANAHLSDKGKQFMKLLTFPD